MSEFILLLISVLVLIVVFYLTIKKAENVNSKNVKTIEDKK